MSAGDPFFERADRQARLDRTVDKALIVSLYVVVCIFVQLRWDGWEAYGISIAIGAACCIAAQAAAEVVVRWSARTVDQ